MAYVDVVRFIPTAGGAADFIVSAAVVGYQTPAAAGAADQATYYYRAESTNLAQWEIGVGTYTASTATLARTTVTANSLGTTAKISFSLVPQVAICILSGGLREKLTASRTYYVRTDGSDSNTGLVNSAGGAFLTIQKAYDLITSTLDLGGNPVAISVGVGTYAAGLIVSALWFGGGQISLTGDTTTPSSVVISVPSGNCISILAPTPGIIVVEGFKFIAAAGAAIFVSAAANLLTGKNEFGACAVAHHYLNAPAAGISNYAAYSITGSSPYHILVNAPGADYNSAQAKTLSGTLAFTQFAYAGSLGFLADSGGYSGGTITGARYSVSGGAFITTNGGGANYFPGNSAGVGGTTTGGGIYS